MNTDFWMPVSLSLQIAGISTVIVLIIGLLLAKLLAKRQFRGKVILETALLLPLVLPPTVIGFLLIIIFGNNSFLGMIIDSVFRQQVMFTPLAAVIASTVVAFPLMYQSAKTGFELVDSGVEDAARVDGADEWKVFLFVTLPLSFRAILTGSILSFARALGEFGATLMFAGNIPGKTQTASTAIYVAFDSGNMEMAWLLVGAMIAISFFMILCTAFLK
ncbi:molybdenum ABC transporter permease [Bacillus methanolicus PB1]|uniref:Molybdenum transport system permease n=1 Tax=Bacillus methanolicus PB1 TaxID=997296 RepID=I3DV90_BACMT|nr:molybdate ABC transporter permease subunit [Bacillus methanolicus]EIJ78161.1 molybdenum ABC transporter permease [Bacillus methanolicus PB1]